MRIFRSSDRDDFFNFSRVGKELVLFRFVISPTALSSNQMEESDDAAYLKDLNLHHTLDFLIRRVLQYRPATRKGVCLVLRDSVDEILSEEDDNKMNSSKYLNNDEPNTGRRVSIPSRRESVHFLTPVDNSIDVGTVSPATANRIAAVDEALASLRQHLVCFFSSIPSFILNTLH